MNDVTPGDAPDQPGPRPGHRPLPGPPPHGPAAAGPARRPLGAPGGVGPYGGPPARVPEPAPAPAFEAADPSPVVDTPESDVPDATGPDAEDDAPQPLGVPVEPTGDPDVDAQLRRLEDADHLAVSGHLEVYEDVHRGLRDTLTALDRHESRS